MRPDRFGQSPNHAFMESAGRDREHAYEGGSSTPGIEIRLNIFGFGFTNSNIGPTPVSLLNFSHWQLYRQCDLVENLQYDIFRFDRELTVEQVATIPRGGFQFPASDPAPYNEGFIKKTKKVWLNLSGQAAFVYGDRFFGINPPEGSETFQSGSFTNQFGANYVSWTLSRPMNLQKWIKFAHSCILAMNEFPQGGIESYSLYPQPGFIPPDEPPEIESFQFEKDVWTDEIGRTFKVLKFSDYMLVSSAATAIERGYAELNILRRTIPGSEWPLYVESVNDLKKFGVPGTGFEIVLTKVLVPVFDKSDRVKRWTVELGGGQTSEMECFEVSPSEVIQPTIEFNSRLDTIHPRAAGTGISYYTMQLPGAVVPGLVLSPSC